MLARTHALARRLRALRNDRAAREADGVFVAEGIHLAAEALDAHASVEAAVVSARLDDSAEGRDVARRLREAGVHAETASDATLASLQDARSPQPVLLIVRHRLSTLHAVLEGRGGSPLAVVACGVQDPGNLGAIWRTADAAGATGLVAAGDCASLTHARTVRASMGSVFRLPAAESGLAPVVAGLRGGGLRIVGATPRGGIPYDTADWSGPVALVLGGEGAGLPPEIAGALDSAVFVPMAPDVESLSVGAAAAVLLFEAARRRRTISAAG
jgi:TrmH family RNA methyltransferase